MVNISIMLKAYLNFFFNFLWKTEQIKANQAVILIKVFDSGCRVPKF